MSFKDPERVLDQFVIGHGRIVADLGAGAGAYTLSLARRVGDTGKVYAIDIQKDLIQRIKNMAASARLRNVDIYWGDIEKQGGTGLSDDSVDAVLISNTLFQTENREGVALEAYRILKKGGRALVIDWSDASSGLGPARNHLVPPEKARAIFEKAGFVFERAIDAGTHHFGMVLRKP